MDRLTLAGLVPVFLAVVVGTQGPAVGAQGPAVGAESSTIFTEAELLAVLGEDHPVVREAAAAVARAEAGLVEARRLENPVLGAVREDPDGPDRQTDFLISWQIPDPGRRTHIEARTAAVLAAEAEFVRGLLERRLDIRAAYAAWAVADERQRRLAARAGRIEALAKRESERFAAGEVSGLEAHRFRLAASTLRSRAALAAAERVRARQAVAAWYPDLPPAARPRSPKVADFPLPAGPSPGVRALAAELAAARLAREAAGRFLASPEVTVGWQRHEVGSGSSDGSGTFDGTVVGLSWSVPLFDRNQAVRDAAEARVEGARARLERAEGEAKADRAGARDRYARLAGALAEAVLELEAQGKLLDGVEAAYRLGEAGSPELLETYRLITDAELAMLELQAATLEAHRDLERLTPTGASLPGASLRRAGGSTEKTSANLTSTGPVSTRSPTARSQRRESLP